MGLMQLMPSTGKGARGRLRHLIESDRPQNEMSAPDGALKMLVNSSAETPNCHRLVQRGTGTRGAVRRTLPRG